jgi:broad specificity phosphatase PhoE
MTAARTRLILVRHAESEGNRDRTFTQSSDVPITVAGREQARAAAARIAKAFRPARIVTSPYARARQTAEIIAAALDLDAWRTWQPAATNGSGPEKGRRPPALEVEPDSALREQSFGIFAGQPYEALLTDAAYHEGPRWQWRPQGGESLVDVYERVVPAFERIARESVERDVVLVSHGGVMLALCAFVTGSWDGLSVTPNAGVLVVEHHDGRYTPPLTVRDS